MEQDRWAEASLKLEELKQEVEALKQQQRELAEGVGELLQTFRSLAMHMGVTTEPYRPGSKKSTPPPGFG